MRKEPGLVGSPALIIETYLFRLPAIYSRLSLIKLGPNDPSAGAGAREEASLVCTYRFDLLESDPVPAPPLECNL